MKYRIKSIRHSDCSYTGPKEMLIETPVIHLDFCADTARLEFTLATDWGGFQETWSCKDPTNMDFIKNLISEGYNNRIEDREQLMDELVNNDTENALAQMTSGKDPVIKDLDGMKANYDKSIETSQKSFQFRHFIKTVPLTNFQTTIIDQKLNGKETHDSDDERFEYAWMRVRLQHAPR